MPTDEKQPVDLGAIGPGELPPDAPSPESDKEERAFLLAQKQAELESYKQDTEERRKYANRIFELVSIWLVGIFVILMVQGFLDPRGAFRLDNSVLLAVVGGTTVNVIGIFVVVVNYLFPKR
jgi:hypothetical protein